MLTNCNDGDVRLSLGVSSNDGIVEYCNAGAWGSLCENTFSFDNAEVVCRQLGLPSGWFSPFFHNTYPTYMYMYTYIALYTCIYIHVAFHVNAYGHVSLIDVGAVLLSNIQSLIRTHRISVSCTGSEASLGECDRTPSGNSSCVDLDIFTRAAVRCQGQYCMYIQRRVQYMYVCMVTHRASRL